MDEFPDEETQAQRNGPQPQADEVGRRIKLKSVPYLIIQGLSPGERKKLWKIQG